MDTFELSALMDSGSAPRRADSPGSGEQAIVVDGEADAAAPDRPVGADPSPTTAGAELLDVLLHLAGAMPGRTRGALDTAIERCLRQVARRLEVDDVTVLQLSSEALSLHATHRACIDGHPAFPVVMTAAEFPSIVAQVRHGGVVQAWPPPAGVRSDAPAEPSWAVAGRPTGYALVPFSGDDSVSGAIALSRTRPRPPWDPATIGWLQLVAGVIGNALARQRAWYALEERISFEHLLSDLAVSLLCAPPHEITPRVQKGLEHVIGYFGIDRCTIGRFSTDEASLVVTHSATAPGVPTAPPRIDASWYLAERRAGRVTQFADGPKDIRGVAIREQQGVRELGACSHLSVPLAAAGRPWGAIEFSAFLQPRRWSEEEVQRLRFVGVIVMDALLAREAEEQGQLRRDELAHMARVAVLGELSAALAHELNQPLMAIRVNAQATGRMIRAGEQPDILEVLGDIALDAMRAGDLIRRLRDLLQRRSLAKESLDVNEVVGAVEAIARTQVERHGAELIVETGPDLPRVMGDAIQLQQVLLNLARNAAEAMAKQAGSREVRIRTWGTVGEHVTVSVEDEGPPITDAIFEGMFTPFCTTKADGLGIGLAISRSIVEAHAGRLWAERRPGAGLAVKLTLPAEQRSAL
jgi:signal transduction histidine kinase